MRFLEESGLNQKISQILGETRVEDVESLHSGAEQIRQTAPVRQAPSSEAVLDELEGEGRVVFRYADNPNGSMRDIAGISSANGRVVGLMPHPEHAVDLLEDVRAASLSARERRLRLSDGSTLSYDKLLIATGSVPIVIPVPGHRLAGVLTYRDLDDVSKMFDAAEKGGRAVVGRFAIEDARERIVKAREIAKSSHAPLWLGVEAC